ANHPRGDPAVRGPGDRRDPRARGSPRSRRGPRRASRAGGARGAGRDARRGGAAGRGRGDRGEPRGAASGRPLTLQSRCRGGSAWWSVGLIGTTIFSDHRSWEIRRSRVQLPPPTSSFSSGTPELFSKSRPATARATLWSFDHNSGPPAARSLLPAPTRGLDGL